MTLKLRDGVSTADTDYGIALLDEDSGDYWNLTPPALWCCEPCWRAAPRGRGAGARRELRRRRRHSEPGRPGPLGRAPLGRPGRPVIGTGMALRRVRPPRRKP
jgi:hypothetical protein